MAAKPSLEEILRAFLESLARARRPVDMAIAAGIALEELDGRDES